MINTPIKTFRTDNGIIVPAITTEQMREVDRIAIGETGPNLYQMMENAGRNLAISTLDMLGSHWQKANIVVLAGPGGNGGGGICAARHLANRNARVSLCLSAPDRLGEVPAFQRKVFQGTPGQEISPEALDKTAPDIVIDALIGYSLKGAPRGTALPLIEWANHQGNVLSLDVPSGIDATSGASAGAFIRSDRTMTLALPKTGLLPEKTGELWLADIGIPAIVYKKLEIDYLPFFGATYLVRLLPDL